MKICLLGSNLTNLILAYQISKKKLPIDIYCSAFPSVPNTSRTIAISSENFQYLNPKNTFKFKYWPCKAIKIYNDKNTNSEILNFANVKKDLFYLFYYSDLYKYFLSKIKKSKFINLKKKNMNNLKKQDISDLSNKYDLIINSETKNKISKTFFFKKINKDYKSYAYTFLINHKPKENNLAIQVFTKYGPLAFLPLSTNKTSIVFSCEGSKKKDSEILSIFEKYNKFIEITKINKVESFNLKFSMLRNYYHNNFLAFGDLLHRIHPLAGQGFNMTIRDINLLNKIIDQKLRLGLQLDSLVCNEFQKESKHFNFIYGYGINAIYEFFKIDNETKNLISSSVFSILNKSSQFKKISKLISDKGIKGIY